MTSGENGGQLLRRDHLQLLECAITRTFVVAPAAKLRGVPKPSALHVVVRDLNHQLRTKRLPRQILPGAPSTLPARHPMRLSLRSEERRVGKGYRARVRGAQEIKIEVK